MTTRTATIDDAQAIAETYGWISPHDHEDQDPHRKTKLDRDQRMRQEIARSGADARDRQLMAGTVSPQLRR